MQSNKQKANPHFSIVIPTHNAEAFIERTIGSLRCQTFEDFEVVVVDDASSDSTVEILKTLSREDPRMRYFVQEENSGTLAARAKGVAEANGKYILLVDQDDELAVDALKNLSTYGSHDIVHFGVKVVPESDDAKKAAFGCEAWLNPAPRMLKGDEILQKQFCMEGNFDWHVHHKVFKADLSKKAWASIPNTRLCTSDDFMMSYILCSYAKNYVAIPNSQWYVYHLGAGETYGSAYTVDHWKSICDADAKAFELIKVFECNNGGSHAEIVQNCQTKLVEHLMNEMHDNLTGNDVDTCIDYALQTWDADAVAAELWRFVRDRAYAKKNDATLEALLKQAERAEGFVRKFDNGRHSQMKEIANVHLSELRGLSSNENEAAPQFKGPSPKVKGPTLFARIKRVLGKG